MLVREALAEALTRLRNEGIDSPRLDAELLLAHTLSANRAAILAEPGRRLTLKELTHYRNLIERRSGREPLAYIVGHREFFGLDFVVDRRVLIPRPETELLVEHALTLARQSAEPIEIADVGAGSGAIAVALAVYLPQATISALDDSTGALEVVAENARRHDVSDRIFCFHSDLLSALQGKVDLITANLPYVTTAEWEELIPEIRDHEPRVALDGGLDGLALISRLLTTAGSHLRAGGAILMEIGAGQGGAVTELARQHFPQADVQLLPDYAGLDRLLVVKIAKGTPAKA
jgi:release factor glutamine methyltransferase